MACLRCGSDCNCACSGAPLPAQDWRRQVSLEVRAHKVRKRRRLDPDSPQLDFNEHEAITIHENSTGSVRAGNSRCGDWAVTSPAPMADAGCAEDSQPVVCSTETRIAMEEAFSRKNREDADASTSEDVVLRCPLPPFPRVNAPLPKIIEFPRMQMRHYELAEPVADQLRIFEAVEELQAPRHNHLSDIEIAPEQPMQYGSLEIEAPIQPAPLGMRGYAGAVDAAIMIVAAVIFTFSAEFFDTSLPMTKPLLGSAAMCGLLLLTIYYFLSLSWGRSTAGMEASGLRIITFSGNIPSRTTLRCRALATVLSYAALGMGFAWSLIDEDRLCWHDRITHTYLTSK